MKPVAPVLVIAEAGVNHNGSLERALDMLRQLQLSEADHQALWSHAARRRIGMLSTPFDTPSLELLTRRLGMSLLKVPSGEITNGPFLLEIARTGCEVILSTGMSSLAEVEAALSVLAFGYGGGKAGLEPGSDAFADAYASAEGRAALLHKVRLLHCTTEYPA